MNLSAFTSKVHMSPASSLCFGRTDAAASKPVSLVSSPRVESGANAAVILVVIVRGESGEGGCIAEPGGKASDNVLVVAGPVDADPGSGIADAMGLGATQRLVSFRSRAVSRGAQRERARGAVPAGGREFRHPRYG